MKKIISASKAIITAVTIAAFELIFVVEGKYETIAGWIRQYSRTISLISIGIISIIIIIAVNGIMWKNDDGKKGFYYQTIIGVLLIAIFVVVKVIDIW